MNLQQAQSQSATERAMSLGDRFGPGVYTPAGTKWDYCTNYSREKQWRGHVRMLPSYFPLTPDKYSWRMIYDSEGARVWDDENRLWRTMPMPPGASLDEVFARLDLLWEMER